MQHESTKDSTAGIIDNNRGGI